MTRPRRVANDALGFTAALLLFACGDKAAPTPPPAPAPAAEPAMDRLTMLKEAQAKIKAERERKREELRKVGSATVTQKKLSGKDKSAKIELTFEFKNNSDKVLTQADGSIALSDASGKLLKQLRVPFQTEIAPGKSAEKRGKFPLDPGKEEDHLLAKTPLKELKVEWLPALYRFEGGSQLQAE
jgi:hypothetical protein